MERRDALSSLSALAAVGLAGCVSDRIGGGPTSDGNGTAPESPDRRRVHAQLRLTGGGCGQQTDRASVAFDGADDGVVVTGTIWGSDLCKVPVIDDVGYDAEGDELSIVVGTSDRETDGETACGQCIAELQYRITASVENARPSTVTVSHDHGDGGTVVTTAQRG